MDIKIVQSLRLIATNLQVGDEVRAHAQMEVLALFAEVDSSTVYAVAEEIREEAQRRDVVARELLLSTPMILNRLRVLQNILNEDRSLQHTEWGA